MKNILNNGSVMRVLRLVMALFVIYQGVTSQQWLFVGLGIFFALVPLLNIGCCGTNNCATPRSNSQKNKETTFTEIK